MPEAPFTLYGSPHSQFTYKVALMLRLCARPFRFRYVSFRTGMHRTPAFLAISPFGQIPVLQHGDRVLCQSAAILEHLSETLRRFGGSDDHIRQTVREVLFWNADRLGPPVYRSHGLELGRRGLLPRAADPAVVAHYRDLADTAFLQLDGKLATSTFLAGQEVTIADIACYGEVAFAPHAGLHISHFRHIQRWTDRIEALPGFKLPFDLLPMADADIA
jgi:glutathione S-transferase